MKFILSNQNLEASAFFSNRSSIIWQILWFQHKSSGKLENWHRPTKSEATVGSNHNSSCLWQTWWIWRLHWDSEGISLCILRNGPDQYFKTVLNSRCIDVEVIFPD